MKIGYARISTKDQDVQPQIDELVKAGCKTRDIYTDTVSGAKTDREGLNRAIEFAEEGDTLVVWKLDRLGRSLPHLIETVGALKKKGVGFKSLTEGLDTNTAGGELIFHIMGALAQFERELIRERTNIGLEAARARGRKGGRKPALSPQKQKMAVKLYQDGEMAVKDIAREMGISEPTLFRYVKEAGVLGKRALPTD